MRLGKAGMTAMVIGAVLMSITVLGQGGGRGDGSGGGDGKQHAGQPGQKKTYNGVQSVEVYSANGTKIYPAETKAKASKSVESPKIDRVTTNENGIRIYFESKTKPERLIEISCKDCILVVDHLNIQRATERNY